MQPFDSTRVSSGEAYFLSDCTLRLEEIWVATFPGTSRTLGGNFASGFEFLWVKLSKCSPLVIGLGAVRQSTVRLPAEYGQNSGGVRSESRCSQ